MAVWRPIGDSSIEQSRPALRGRVLLVTLGVLLLALAAFIAWQTGSGLANIQRMMTERSVALHRVITAEVRNVARYGAGRRERLDEILGELVEGGHVEGISLERRGGSLRLQHGKLPAAASASELAPARLLHGSTMLVSGPLRIETSGCHESPPLAADQTAGAPRATSTCPVVLSIAPGAGGPSVACPAASDAVKIGGSGKGREKNGGGGRGEGGGASGGASAGGGGADRSGGGAEGDATNVAGGNNPAPASGCGPVCPAATDETIDGDYRLLLAFDAAPYLVLRSSVRWQGAAGAVLCAALALAFWLFSRQSRRAADMRQALALTDARARHLESLSLVAGGLAHEIKNPLGAMRGFAQLLAEKVPPGSEQADYAALMVAELDGITRRLDGLRNFTRPRPLDLRPARPGSLVRHVAALLAPDIAARNLSIELELPPAPEPEALLDEDRLRDLVVNLVMNAIEASPAGGKIRLALALDGAGSDPRAGEHFRLEVSDEGPGIAEKEHQRCLRPFSSTKPGGLGLGLALAQRAVEDHGGTLEIDATPGGGALLRARWPRRPAP